MSRFQKPKCKQFSHPVYYIHFGCAEDMMWYESHPFLNQSTSKVNRVFSEHCSHGLHLGCWKRHICLGPRWLKTTHIKKNIKKIGRNRTIFSFFYEKLIINLKCFLKKNNGPIFKCETFFMNMCGHFDLS
jgi:hypothetical protein